MEIKIEQEHVQQIISDAILKELGEEKRNLLISQAIDMLLKQQTTGSGYNQRSFIPLHESFNNAAQQVSMKIAREYLESNEDVQNKIKQLLVDAIERVFTTKREEIITKIADAFEKGFESRGY